MGDPNEDPRICDDGLGTHVWLEPFEDGDSCTCGAFYLDQQKGNGLAAVLKERLPDLSAEKE